MAKRVNTPNPLMLMGFFTCFVGVSILGYLYYQLTIANTKIVDANIKLISKNDFVSQNLLLALDKLER